MRRTAVLAACLLLAGACGHERDPGAATIACAASLRRVMPALAQAYGAQVPGSALRFSYAGSGTLRQQALAGAPVDGVIFAGPGYVEALVQGGLARAGEGVVLARNEIVLVGRRAGPGYTFATLARATRIAAGDPRSVPAGGYAKQYLERLGLWGQVRGRLVHTQDVAGVLAYVRRGEVDAGIAYATEVVGVPEVVVLDRATGEDAPTPVVVATAVAEAPGAAAARAFLGWLRTPPARAIWARHGFLAP